MPFTWLADFHPYQVPSTSIIFVGAVVEESQSMLFQVWAVDQQHGCPLELVRNADSQAPSQPPKLELAFSLELQGIHLHSSI